MIPVETHAATTDSALHLRLTFAAQLPRRLEEIVRQVRSLEVEAWNPRRVDFLHRLVHSLSSSAEAFGLPTLAAVSRPLEVNLARLLGRVQQPKNNEVQRIADSLDELVRVVEAHLASIALPLSNDALTLEDEGQAATSHLLTTSSARIYCVRDVPEQARALQQLLLDAHYQVEVFGDVESLRTACQQHGWPQLILFDLVHSELENNAIQLMTQLRASGPPTLQLVMVSARSDVPSRLAMYRAGANHCFSRPLQIEPLLQLLEKSFDQPVAEPFRIVLLAHTAESPQCLALSQLLQEAGMQVVSSADLLQVFTLLEKFDADLVVLEHDMDDVALLLRDHNEHLALALQAMPQANLQAIPQANLQLSAQSANQKEEGLRAASVLPSLQHPTRLLQAISASAQQHREQQMLRKQLLHVRYEREREHESLNQHAIVSITDDSGKISFVNDKFCRVSGFSRPELIGRNHRVLKSGQHAPSYYQDLWRSIAHGHIWHGEICNRNKEGGLYWLDTTITPFQDRSNKPYQYLAIHSEVTASKAQEKALQEAQRMVRLGQQEVVANTMWQSLAADMFGPHGQQLSGIDEVLSSEGEIEEVIHRVVRADGQVRYVRESGRSSVGTDGRLQRTPGSVEDVTDEQVMHASEKRVMADFAGKNGSVKADFLPNISNQLRTPLHAIICYLQWLRREHGGGNLALAMRHGLPEIAKTGQYLLALVADVLDLARLEAGRMDLKLEPVSLQELFLSCEAHTVALAAASSISIHFDLGECVRCKVMADAVRLKQALLNLISNALKYNRPNGKVQVNASFISNELGQKRLQISVTDTGYGISREKLVRLYTPFDRLDAEQGKIKGTGLGLAISRQILQLMGGQIGVESSVGLGSTFMMELLLAPEKSWLQANTTPELSSTATSHTTGVLLHMGGESRMNVKTELDSVPAELAVVPSGKRRKIVLYIEDNAASQRLMYKVISKRSELEFVEAMTAEIGLPLAKELQPALILLDINLPGIDGYQALTQLRSTEGLQHTPVVAVTANAMKGDAERGLAAGFTAYVAKPLDIEQFYALLDRLLGTD